MRKYFVVTLCFFAISFSKAQRLKGKPKLIVAIVVDQMRYDYLERFNNTFSPNGFKRLIREYQSVT